MNKGKRLLVTLSATMVSTVFGVAQAGGISSPGYPNFSALNYSASLGGSAKSGYTLRIDGDSPNIGSLNFPSGSYLVGHEEIELVAHFDSHGHLLTNRKNTIQIEGSIAASNHPSFGAAPGGTSWSAQKPETTLFEADLTRVGVDSKGESLGFTTTDFSGWATQFAPPNPTESLWLFSVGAGKNSWGEFLAEIKHHSPLEEATFPFIGSVATVPLPATALLLLSGLAGLGGLARRRMAPIIA